MTRAASPVFARGNSKAVTRLEATDWSDTRDTRADRLEDEGDEGRGRELEERGVPRRWVGVRVATCRSSMLTSHVSNPASIAGDAPPANVLVCRVRRMDEPAS